MFSNGSFTPPHDPRIQTNFDPNELSRKFLQELNELNSNAHLRHYNRQNGYFNKSNDNRNRRKIFGKTGALSHQPRSLCELGYLEMIKEIFTGNTPQLKTLISENSDNLVWLPILFLDCFFNSIASIVLVSNPFSGLLIFIAQLHSTPGTSLVATVALLSGIFTSLVIVRIPPDTVRSGGVTLNSFLIGTAMGEMARAAGYDVLLRPELLIAAMIAGSLVIFIWGGLNGIYIKLFNSDISLLNSPFNLIALLYLTSGWANLFVGKVYPEDSLKIMESNLTHNQTLRMGKSFIPSSFLQSLNQTSNREPQEMIDWIRVVGGALMGPSPIFGVNTIPASILIYFALLLYSPILSAQGFMGSLIGTLIGAAVTSISNNLSLEDVYNGNWGYSSLLTQAAIGGYFYSLNIHSFLLSVVGSVLTAFLYASLALGQKPIFGFPFWIVTTLLCLSNFRHSKTPEVQTGSPVDPFISQLYYKVPLDEIETPEIHRRFRQNLARILP